MATKVGKAAKVGKTAKVGKAAKVGKTGAKAKAGKSAGRAASKAAGKVAKGYTVLRVAQRVVTPSEKKKRTNKPALIGVALVTGAGVYFFDPAQGARRRNVARDRAMALLRRGKRQAAQKGDYAAGQVKGAVHEARAKATPDAPKPDLTDQDLARKVESIVFRDAEAPKGKINVDATGRTVWLRGEVPSEEMEARLVAETQAITEVEQVENLLHLPGTPAPTRADAPTGEK